MATAVVSGGLSSIDWTQLINRISKGKCTPFLGAGACHPTLPLGTDIAREWAREHNYPLDDRTNLSRVAQFLAVKAGDPVFPKEEILKELALHKGKKPKFDEPGEPHSVIARLPLPVYLTTNYDDFLFQALEHHGKKPRRELCYWNQHLKDLKREQNGSAGSGHYKPSANEPLVYHLHGHHSIEESLVLTENDYLDFLANFETTYQKGKEPFLPAVIQEALTEHSLLFIGYSLEDRSFRVVFRSLVSQLDQGRRKVSVTVQIAPLEEEEMDKLYLKSGNALVGKVLKHAGGKIEFATELLEEVTLAESHDNPQDDHPRMRQDTLEIDESKVAAVVTCEDRQQHQEQKRQYLDQYFNNMKIKVFWGTAKEFACQLAEKWEARENDQRPNAD